MIEMWRREYNTIRPHSALGYRPPAPEAILFQPTQFQQVGLTYGVVHISGAGHLLRDV
jgi:transposase InsO family protein